MRRTARKVLYVIACLLSGALCFAAVVSWARSEVTGEGMWLSKGPQRYMAAAFDGFIIIDRRELQFDDPSAEQRWLGTMDPDRRRGWASNSWNYRWIKDMGGIVGTRNSFLGFGADASTGDVTRGQGFFIPGVHWKRGAIQFPHWIIVLLT